MKGFLLVICLLLPGCGTKAPESIEVRAQPAQIDMLPSVRVPRPELAIHEIDQQSSVDMLTRAYVASLRQMIDYAYELELVIRQLQSLHVDTFSDPFFNTFPTGVGP